MTLVLLDRDGVLNEDRPDSVRSAADLVMLPRSAAAVAKLNRAGLPVAVVTNQSIVGRGIIDAATLDTIHAHLQTMLGEAGARLDAIITCPDAPDAATERRKPGPGMLIEAMNRFGATPESTVMIGDDLKDLRAATAADCARILVRTGKGRAMEAAGLPATVYPLDVHDDLSTAVDAILAADAPVHAAGGSP